MKYLNKVKHVRLLDEYRLSVTFRDGFVGEIDLWPAFENPRGPLTREFHEPGFFRQVYLDHGTVSWPNGYDICSDVLRYYCELGRVATQEEVNAYFARSPQTAGETLVMNDKPND
jgi:hypothetical protein